MSSKQGIELSQIPCIRNIIVLDEHRRIACHHADTASRGAFFRVFGCHLVIVFSLDDKAQSIQANQVVHRGCLGFNLVCDLEIRADLVLGQCLQLRFSRLGTGVAAFPVRIAHGSSQPGVVVARFAPIQVSRSSILHFSRGLGSPDSHLGHSHGHHEQAATTPGRLTAGSFGTGVL